MAVLYLYSHVFHAEDSSILRNQVQLQALHRHVCHCSFTEDDVPFPLGLVICVLDVHVLLDLVTNIKSKIVSAQIYSCRNPDRYLVDGSLWIVEFLLFHNGLVEVQDPGGLDEHDTY